MDPAEPPEFLHRRDLDKLNAGVAALLDDPTDPPFIQPDISADGWLSIPEGIGYPYTRERLDMVRRE